MITLRASDSKNIATFPIVNETSPVVTMKVSEVLKNQFYKDDFSRTDIVVRLLVVESYMKDKNYNFELYKKMQKSRMSRYQTDTKGLEYCINGFKALIWSMKDNGYDEKKPICNTGQFLYDGSHRLACAIYFHINSVTVEVGEPIEEPIYYGLKWFEKYFTRGEVNTIRERQERLLQSIE